MARTPLPPLAAVVSFIDCINRTDLAGLAALMRDDHQLIVLDEPPLVGKQANVDAWRGYFSAYPEYVIYPRALRAGGSEGRVVVEGVTTGSHLGLPDDEEKQLDVVWKADVVDGALALWQVAASAAMGTIHVWSQFDIEPGKAAQFRAALADMVAAVQEDEPGPLDYQFFLNVDETVCHGYERFADEEAVMAHGAGRAVGDGIPRLMAVSKFSRFEVHGALSDGTKQFMAGVGATIFEPAVGLT